MKRRIAAFLLVMAAVPMSFASGAQETAAGPISISFYYYGTQVHMLYFNPIKEGFVKAYPHITITPVEVTSGSYEALCQKILLALAAGDAPDVGQVGYHLLRTMVDSGGAVALDSFMASDPKFDKDNLFPAMMGLGVMDGQQYLIPIGTSTPALYTNLDLFASVGLDPKAPPKSWDEARQAAQKLKDNGKMGVLWGWYITGNWIFQAMLENAGGRMADEAGTRATFNSEAGLKTLSYMADLASAGLMPVTDQGVPVFVAGNLGMLVESSFQRVNTPMQAKFKVRLSAMPTPEGKLPLVPAGGNGAMMFSKDPAKRNAAWQFMRWMTEEEVSRIVANNSGYTPANQAVVRALKIENAADQNFVDMLNQVERVTPWQSWRGANGTEISKLLRDMQQSVLLGRVPAKQALDEAAAKVNELLK